MNKLPLLVSIVLAFPLTAAEPELHWSFRPVTRPNLPPVRCSPSDIQTPIDRFIQARLEQAGLSLSPTADRGTLIRRLKFNLLGLPPTPHEVDAFRADTRPDAYERLVEQYLSSPQFGERWARHWLDVVRFAESDGFEMNQPRPMAWPYRDWVIAALNADLPYDRFIREQLAGDQLGADAATGFLVGGAYDKVKSPDPGLTALQRADELHDMVSTTTSAFLGLTAGCARCHDHKFDPISQADYYALKAVFEGVQHGERPLTPVDPEKRQRDADELQAQLAAVTRELEALEPLANPQGPPGRAPVNARRNVERFAPIEARFVRFTIQATNSVEPCIDELEVFTAGASPRNVAVAAAGTKVTSSGDYAAAPQIHRLEFLVDGQHGNARSWISNEVGAGWVQIELKEPATIDRIVWARDREGKFTDRLAVKYRIEAALEPQAWTVVASSDDRLPFESPSPPVPPAIPPGERAAFQSLSNRRDALRAKLSALQHQAMVYAGTFTKAAATHRLHRGDPMQPRELIAPGGLAEFGATLKLAPDSEEAQRRRKLADWIADPQHPLTARVIVNRLWQYHFGTGLVDTPSDFGRNGTRPTHPELLDWLADQLIRSGWQLKAIHRLIVHSATFRQSSAANSAGLNTDAASRLVWRFPPRRLEAEPLRDAILAVSGNLDPRMGGVGFDLFEPNTNYVRVYNPKKSFGPTEWRRMIYQNKPRMQLDDTFGAFDCPDAGQIAPKRNASTTALQALNLLNGRFILQQADLFAGRLRQEAGNDVNDQVRQAFRLIFQRDPTEEEQSAGRLLVEHHGLSALTRALFNTNEFVFLR